MRLAPARTRHMHASHGTRHVHALLAPRGAAPLCPHRARLAGEALALEYARSPADVSGVTSALPPGFAKARDVAIIFHGSGGPDRETADVLARFREQDVAAGLRREVIVFNWMPWFTANTDRLSFQSSGVGSEIGRALAANPALRSLHVVGTSAGSFAADACCSGYVASCVAAGGDKQRAAVRLTLADPFAAKEGASFQSGRGAQLFGRCAALPLVRLPREHKVRVPTAHHASAHRDADFAEHYLNTDDIVPNTEAPLPLCACYDVTGCVERKAFPPPEKTGDFVYDLILKSLGYHSWPMGYVARHYQTTLDAEGKLVLPSHDDTPRGTVVKVA